MPFGAGVAIASLLAALSALPGCSPGKGETDGESTDVTAPMGSTGSTDSTGSTTGPDTTTDPTTGAASAAATTGAPDPTGDPVEPDPELASLCQDYFAQMTSGHESLCTCLIELGGHPDQASCAEELLIPTQEQIDCQCGVYAMHPESKPGLECATSAALAYQQCIASTACGEEQLLCFDQFMAALFGECEMSFEASEQIEETCFGGDPDLLFICGSGEEIPHRWFCDGQEDCADGSDEADCR